MIGDRERWITAASALAVAFVLSIPALLLPYALYRTAWNGLMTTVLIGTGTGPGAVLILGAVRSIGVFDVVLISVFLVSFDIAGQIGLGYRREMQWLLVSELCDHRRLTSGEI